MHAVNARRKREWQLGFRLTPCLDINKDINRKNVIKGHRRTKGKKSCQFINSQVIPSTASSSTTTTTITAATTIIYLLHSVREILIHLASKHL